jgi:beta-glucosidase-like glycosyl hydrolase
MGGVQKACPIDQAGVETLRAGSDIYLVCHNEEFVWRSYEGVLKEAEKDKKFAKLVAQAADRVLKMKAKHNKMLRKIAKAPTQKTIDKLRRQIWEFGEEIRLEAVAARQR